MHRFHPRPAAARRAASRRGALAPLLAVAIVAPGCALPGRSYAVAPALSGVLLRGGEPVTEGDVRRAYRARDTPTLSGADFVPLDDRGRFAFEVATEQVAGREFRKTYSISLSHRTGNLYEALWFQTYDRRELPERVKLRCELSRSARDSEMPCTAVEP